MKALTFKQRMELGVVVARTQTLVLRAFRYGLDERSEFMSSVVDDLAVTLTGAEASQRVFIVDSTEQCISMMSERHRGCALNNFALDRANRTERALHLAIARAIEKLTHMESADEYEFAPSHAFG